MKKNQKSTKNKGVFIPVNAPAISSKSKAYLRKAIDSGWISSSGPMVSKFEKEFAAFAGTKEGVSVSNGTAALHVALLTLGVGKGDEVIVPAFTMAATWLAVLYTGAKPIFVDCDPYTYNIDPSLISAKITRKTKAIIAVHIYGLPCDMDAINRIAKKHKLFVIEDAAEAHGATYKSKPCGSLGDIGCFSFYGNKIVTTGEGGMIVTDNLEWATRARRLRDLHHSAKKRFIHDGIGYNYRFTNLQAAVGLGELGQIKTYLRKKREMAVTYTKGLKKVAGITLPPSLKDRTNVHWMYAILIDEETFGMSRDELRRVLLEDWNIDTRDFFYSPSEQPVLEPLVKRQRFPVTDSLAQRGLYLPSGLALTQKEMRRVITALQTISAR